MKVPFVCCMLALISSAKPVSVKVSSTDDRAPLGVRLPSRAEGREIFSNGVGYTRQWPGTYFETAFRGKAAVFEVGPGDVILHVVVDEIQVATLRKPKAGRYRVSGLTSARHVLRVEVASESQAAPTNFGGFFAEGVTRPISMGHRQRQIEFIGDSHTVGYSNTSTKQECTTDEVWDSTDTSRSFGAVLAKRYEADYQVNAISGRGVVRNYNGFSADPLPVVYPFVLFDKVSPSVQPRWRPNVMVIALGTNDFTTPLRDGEKWKTRNALHADFRQTYVRFVRSLRARNPRAFFILWATDKANGEIKAEVGKVVASLQASGERRLAYVPIDGLSFSACHSHPSLADEERIASELSRVIEFTDGIWN